MSIIGSPFDLSADIFTHKYAAQDDGQGQQGGQATNDFQTTGSYDTACDVLKAWRNCKISKSDAKVKVRELVSDARAWESKDWDDFFEDDCPDIPNERTRDAEVSAWGEWSDCAPNWLGQGTQNRKRTIVKRKRTNCIDSIIQGVTLNEFRDCELPDDSGSGDSGSGDSGSGDSGSGDSGSGEAVTLEAVTLEAVTLEAVTLEAVTLEAVTLEAVTLEAVMELILLLWVTQTIPNLHSVIHSKIIGC